MVLRSFLLLHGFGNRRPPEHWLHWLAAGLRNAGHGVVYPQLPEPDEPVLSDWSAALDGHLEELRRVSTSAERIVICHSLSCLLWLHVAARGLDPALTPDRLLLVSPPGTDWIPEPASGFAVGSLDAAALRDSAGTARIVCSDADPYNPRGAQTDYAVPLGLPCDVIAGGGHLSSDDGYGPWPAMRAWCDAPGGPVGG